MNQEEVTKFMESALQLGKELVEKDSLTEVEELFLSELDKIIDQWIK